MFYVKVHRSEGREVLGVCDEDLLGKRFSSGDLEVDVSIFFFKGELSKKENVMDLLNNCNNASFVGKNIINLAVEMGVINKDQVINISDIPTAMVFSI